MICDFGIPPCFTIIFLLIYLGTFYVVQLYEDETKKLGT